MKVIRKYNTPITTQFLSGLAKTKLTRQQFDNIKRGVLLISYYLNFFTFVTVSIVAIHSINSFRGLNCIHSVHSEDKSYFILEKTNVYMNHSPSRTVRIPCVVQIQRNGFGSTAGDRFMGVTAWFSLIYLFIFLVTKTTEFLLSLVHKYSIYYNHSSCAKIKAVLQSVKKKEISTSITYTEK